MGNTGLFWISLTCTQFCDTNFMQLKLAKCCFHNQKIVPVWWQIKSLVLHPGIQK